MPKVINQNEALIEKLSMQVDSLSAKLQHLDTKFTILKSNNQILADSISTLTKSVNQSSIATTFYDTHLATYTAIFSVIVALILTIAALINWLGLIKPQEKKFNKLVDALQENLDNFKKDYIDELIDDLKEVSGRSMQTVAVNNETSNPDVSFIFSVRLLKLMSNWDKTNENVYKNWIGYTEEFLDRSEFAYTDIDEGVYEEMVENLSSILAITDDASNKSRINRILSRYMSAMEAVKAEHESQTTLDLQESDEETQPSQD